MTGFRRPLRPMSLLLAGLLACSEPSGILVAPVPDKPPVANPAKASNPTVSSTVPNESIRDTTLDVRVLGSGFDAGTNADFLLAGAADAKVRTNSTSFVSSTELVANITIDADAVPAYRDVAVTTSTGKKGIGTERFIVLEPVLVPTPGSSDAFAWDVNSTGLVVGHYSVGGTTCTQRAFAWSETSGSQTLPLPPGHCQAKAYKVNEGGMIVGASWPDGGAFGTTGVVARWLPAGPGAWTVEVLPKPAANLSWLATAGLDEAGNTGALWLAGGTSHTWVWRNLIGWTALALPPGKTGCVVQIQGMSVNTELVGCSGAAQYWSSPTASPVALPFPSGATSPQANAINALGVIVGGYTTGSGSKAVSRVARWRPNGSGGWLVDNLGTNLVAKDVNDDGTIVGVGYAWLPASGFSALDPLSKTQPSFVQAVSNRGPSGVAWIVGYGKSNAGGAQRALLWRR